MSLTRWSMKLSCFSINVQSLRCAASRIIPKSVSRSMIAELNGVRNSWETVDVWHSMSSERPFSSTSEQCSLIASIV